MLTPVIRPRRRSGVSSWRTTLRMTMLTVSVAPVIARHANVSQKERESAEDHRGQAVGGDRPEQREPAPLDPLGHRHHRRARRHRADGRRRVEPAVAFRADLQDVLREDRQQRGRRRKNVAKKSSSIVERMSGERNTKRSPSSAACNETSSRDPASGRRRAGTSRIISSADDDERERNRVGDVDPADAGRGDQHAAERRTERPTRSET